MTIGEELVVLSANCQGLQNKSMPPDFLDYLSKTRALLICLRDTHWRPNYKSLIRSIWNGDCIINGYFFQLKRCCIFACHNLKYNKGFVSNDDSVNVISLDIHISEYNKSKIQLTELSKLSNYCQRC